LLIVIQIFQKWYDKIKPLLRGCV